MRSSGDDVADDMAMEVGEAEIAADVVVGEALVVEAHEMQNRPVQVVDVNAVFDGAEADVVGGATGSRDGTGASSLTRRASRRSRFNPSSQFRRQVVHGDGAARREFRPVAGRQEGV